MHAISAVQLCITKKSTSEKVSETSPPVHARIYYHGSCRVTVYHASSHFDKSTTFASQPVGEVCTCHRQIPPSDWRVPTAAVEVQPAQVQALLQNPGLHGAAMRNLHSANGSFCADVNLLLRQMPATEKLAEMSSFQLHACILISLSNTPI